MAMATIEADIKALKSELQQLRKDFARLIDTLDETARHGREEVVEQARRSAEGLRTEAAEAVDAAREEIRRRPLSSLLSVFAVGFVLGSLFSGRR